MRTCATAVAMRAFLTSVSARWSTPASQGPLGRSGIGQRVQPSALISSASSAERPLVRRPLCGWPGPVHLNS